MLGGTCSACCCPKTDKPDSVTVVLSSTMQDRIIETQTQTRYFFRNGVEHSYARRRQTLCLLGNISGTYTLAHVPELDYEVSESGGVISSHSIYVYTDNRLELSMVVTTGDFGLPYNGGSFDIRWRLSIFLTMVRRIEEDRDIWRDTLQPKNEFREWTPEDIMTENAGIVVQPIVTSAAAISIAQTCARDTWSRYGSWSGEGHPLTAERLLSYPLVQLLLPSVTVTGQNSRSINIPGQVGGFDLLVWDYFTAKFPIEVTGVYETGDYFFLDVQPVQLRFYYAFGQYTYLGAENVNESRASLVTGRGAEQSIPFNVTIEAVQYVYGNATTNLPL